MFVGIEDGTGRLSINSTSASPAKARRSSSISDDYQPPSQSPTRRSVDPSSAQGDVSPILDEHEEQPQKNSSPSAASPLPVAAAAAAALSEEVNPSESLNGVEEKTPLCDDKEASEGVQAEGVWLKQS